MRFLKYILLAVGLIVAYSCDKDELEKITISETPIPSVLAEYAEAIIITKENLNTENIDLSWTKTDFGYQAAVTYALVGNLKESAGSTSEEVVVPIEVAVFKLTTVSIKISVINEAVLKMDAIANRANDIEFSIQAYLTETSERIGSSNKIEIAVTPFAVLQAIFVPGAHQGWAPATAPALQLTDKVKTIYSGFVYFGNDNQEYKFVGQRTGDPDNWGGALDALVAGGGNIMNLTKGMCFFEVDIPNLKATAQQITKIGLVGDATVGGWPGDGNLTPDALLTVDATGFIFGLLIMCK